MASFCLTLILIHYAGADAFAVCGFTSEAECQGYGRAWMAHAMRRESDDVALFRCRAVEVK